MAATRRDAQIGRNVALHRNGRSQQDIADEMRARGWRWAQATVWSIEKGERPLRLAEAADLAEVLEVDVSQLVESDTAGEVAQAIGMARRARERAVDSWLAYHQAASHLGDVMEVAEQQIPGIADVFGEELDALAPKRVADEMRRRYGAEGWGSARADDEIADRERRGAREMLAHAERQMAGSEAPEEVRADGVDR